MTNDEIRSCTVAFDSGEWSEKPVHFTVRMDIKAATVYCATAENEGITPGARQDAINEICMQFPVDANEQLGDTIWQRDWPVTWPHLSVVPDNVRPHDLPHITHRFLHS